MDNKTLEKYKKQCEILKGKLGAELRQERKRLGLTIFELFLLTDWDLKDISNFERNAVNTDMYLSKYIRISDLVKTLKSSETKSIVIGKLTGNAPRKEKPIDKRYLVSEKQKKLFKIY